MAVKMEEKGGGDRNHGARRNVATGVTGQLVNVSLYVNKYRDSIFIQ